MKFIADLHLHSKYSRATARNLDFENLYYAAQIKGVRVVGTGDFTYPAWIEEIESKLEETEPGLFCLKKEIAREIDKTVPEKCHNPVRFILQTEISNIYKKDDRVRKNHNLVYFPDIESVKEFNAKLDSIGNIKSDGRPILGLDAENLLSIMLDINDKGFFVPAHIWTPWFSMFGSKSGFDSIEACFGSLKDHIFAVETGLSSDPPMNWRVEQLDNIRLISNSDAHSPGYIGRNASVFDTDLSFFHIRQALEKNDLKKYQGTLDMYPHQGKYHYDGHRKCNICLNPATTAKIDGICPECGRKVTYGVLNRVQELATRPEGYQPGNRHGFKSIIPLTDILSEIFEVGPKTKKVATHYNRAIKTLGPELSILLDKSYKEIETANVPLLAEAILKMRTGDVRIDPGFDGEYGKVNLFSKQEKEQLKGEKYFLFNLPVKKGRARRKAETRVRNVSVGKENQENETQGKKNPEKKIIKRKSAAKQPAKSQDLLTGLNPEQQKAVESSARATIIQAGPGTGKTRTLTAKIAWLVSKKDVDPASILALTFTNKAAEELKLRIEKHLSKKKKQVLATTFHSFCLGLLKEYKGFNAFIADDELRLSLIREAMGAKTPKKTAQKIGQMISSCKQYLLSPGDNLKKVLPKEGFDNFKKVYQAYQNLCKEQHVVDFEDLIFMTIQMLTGDEKICFKVQKRFRYVFIDEYQDLNFGQYELFKLISKTSQVVVIGDPDQSIYGFRGSDRKYFKQFARDFPGCEKIVLIKNYRSTQTILNASFQMISRSLETEEKIKIFSDAKTHQKLIIKETATAHSEAVAIGKMIEKLVGGTSFFSMDAGKTGVSEQKEYSFADFAILCRTRRQYDTFVTIFEKEGIPFQAADKKALFEIEGIKQLIHHCTRAAQGEDFKNGLKESDSKIWLNFFWEKEIKDQHLIDNDRTKKAFKELLSLAELYTNLKDFLNALALNQDTDVLEFNVEKVSLMTLHAAKGLEFPVVFVAGCEQGFIPFAKDGKNIEDLEEERRLFYVAMTRAMDILCLTYAKKRSIYGKSVKRQRSFFIEDIEKNLMKMEKSMVYLDVRKKEKQLELF